MSEPPRSSDTPRSRIVSSITNTAVMAGAAVAAQVVSFAGTLVNARLYGPYEVGLFGLFNVVFTFAVFAASWRYELAIVTTESDDGADDVALFVFACGLASSLLALAALVVLEALPVGAGLSLDLRRALLGLPASLVLASVLLAGNGLCTRQHRFGRVAVQQVALVVATFAAQVALARVALPGSGLVTGFVVGQLIACLVFVHPLSTALIGRLRQTGVAQRLRRVAAEHRGHFFFTVPYSLFTQVYFQAPIVLLAAWFGTREVGFFSLAFRTTFTPISLVPNAVGQVFFPQMARQRDRLSTWEGPLLAVLTALGVLLAPAVAIILVFGQELYTLILGGSWREAGRFAQIMIVANLLNGLAGGYDRLYFVQQRQRTALVLTCIVLLLSLAMMLAAIVVGSSPEALVVGWTLGHLVMTIAWMVTIFRISGFSVRTLAARWLVILAVVAGLSFAAANVAAAIAGEASSVVIVSVIGLAYAAVILRLGMPLRTAWRPGDSR
jgi:O-antigen/teichoic acid export membrane protein